MWVLLSYLLGSVPFGLVVAGLHADVDPREEGSANVGATNVLRTAGPTLGAIALFLDLVKGVLATSVGWMLGGPGLAALAGAAAVVGHCWSIFLAMRGGKGVATACGVLLVLTPGVALIATLSWGVTFALSRRSSLGALVSLPVIGIAALWLYPEHLLMVGLVGAVVAIRHAPNIRRLVSGTELDFRKE